MDGRQRARQLVEQLPAPVARERRPIHGDDQRRVRRERRGPGRPRTGTAPRRPASPRTLRPPRRLRRQRPRNGETATRRAADIFERADPVDDDEVRCRRPAAGPAARLLPAARGPTPTDSEGPPVPEARRCDPSPTNRRGRLARVRPRRSRCGGSVRSAGPTAPRSRVRHRRRRPARRRWSPRVAPRPRCARRRAVHRPRRCDRVGPARHRSSRAVRPRAGAVGGPPGVGRTEVAVQLAVTIGGVLVDADDVAPTISGTVESVDRTEPPHDRRRRITRGDLDSWRWIAAAGACGQCRRRRVRVRPGEVAQQRLAGLVVVDGIGSLDVGGPPAVAA